MRAYIFSTVMQQKRGTSYVKQTCMHNFKRLSCFNHVACCITQQQQKVSTSNICFFETVIHNWANSGTAGFATQRLGSNNIGFAGILQDCSQNINVFFTSYFRFFHCQEPFFSTNIFFTRSNSCIADTFTWLRQSD